MKAFKAFKAFIEPFKIPQRANQLTGVYMRATLVLNVLTTYNLIQRPI